jgi:truncated hemoglobin YjbI
MGIAVRDSSMMREASRLAAGSGELGNTDAIRLLQIPHRREDTEAVLQSFGDQLTPQARSKLTLDAWVPPPADVVNQRYEPIFDKYPITGKTYTTASGAIIPNELQYFNGQMAHFYGECANIAAVNDALAGSGYTAMTLRYADGRETAIAQVWCSRFTDTSIGPYSAMFIVVVAVPDAAQNRTAIAADANGASSALPMFDGSFDAAANVYENRARLFLVRLLDTTRVAIDVGRERMGTDKRPGSIDVALTGRRLRVSVRDQFERPVMRGEVDVTSDPAGYLPAIAKAAATAGIAVRPLPPGTEYSYPVVARIDRGPVVSWQWRSDVVPRVQPIASGSVTCDSSSEEGRLLVTWGFAAKVLAFSQNVRGVVTGLSDSNDTRAFAGAVASSRPTRAIAQPRAQGESLPLLRAAQRGQAVGIVGALPVLRLVAASESASRSPSPDAPRPRWAWGTTFLGSLTALLREEVVGVTPDGLRINWHVTTGSFVGPDLDAIVLPGAADWMRIRRDGIAIVNVQACFETRDGTRVFGAYGGIFDLGPDGFERALRNEYDDLPPVVVTPTYATADARLAWLNRAQCIGVGRVDMKALRVEFDVYVVRVGDRIEPESATDGATRGSVPALTASLYDRLGGQRTIEGITDDFVAAVLADNELGRFFANAHIQSGLRDRVVDLLCQITGGPCVYKGRDMKSAHKGLGITYSDWTIAVNLFARALDRRNVSTRERSEFLHIIEQMKDQVVEIPNA